MVDPADRGLEKVFREMVSSPATGTDWADLLVQICENIRLSLGFDRCSVSIIEADGKHFRTVVGSVSDARFEFSPAGSTYSMDACATVVESARAGKPFFFESPLDKEWGSGLAHFLPKNPPVKGVCLVPLQLQGKTAGFLHCYDFQTEREYTRSLRRALSGEARLVAMLLEYAMLSLQLTRSEAHYRALVELSNDLVFMVDPDGVITYASPTARDVCGLEPGKTVREFLDQVHPEDKENTERAWEAWLQATGLQNFENRLLSTAGKEHRGFWNVQPVRDANGLLTHIQCIGRDFTARYRLDEKLRNTQRAESIARLARGFAHEFNNMLVSVLGSASVLEAQMAEDHPWRAIAHDIVTGAERAAKLTKQLLTYARGTVPSPQPLRLSELLSESLDFTGTMLPNNIDIRTEIDTGGDWIDGDPVQMQQVVLNLVQNAAESMPEGGSVTIRVQEGVNGAPEAPVQPPAVMLTVEDHGWGIPPDDRDQIFDPFFSTKEMGRGLGLAAVQAIVQSHGGKVEVESTPGQGSTFLVTLPTRAS